MVSQVIEGATVKGKSQVQQRPQFVGVHGQVGSASKEASKQAPKKLASHLQECQTQHAAYRGKRAAVAKDQIGKVPAIGWWRNRAASF